MHKIYLHNKRLYHTNSLVDAIENEDLEKVKKTLEKGAEPYFPANGKDVEILWRLPDGQDEDLIYARPDKEHRLDHPLLMRVLKKENMPIFEAILAHIRNKHDFKFSAKDLIEAIKDSPQKQKILSDFVEKDLVKIDHTLLTFSVFKNDYALFKTFFKNAPFSVTKHFFTGLTTYPYRSHYYCEHISMGCDYEMDLDRFDEFLSRFRKEVLEPCLERKIKKTKEQISCLEGVVQRSEARGFVGLGDIYEMQEPRKELKHYQSILKELENTQKNPEKEIIILMEHYQFDEGLTKFINDAITPKKNHD